MSFEELAMQMQDNYQSKVEHLQRMLQNTNKQADLIEKDEIGALVDTLDERQRIMDGVDVLDGRLDKFYQELLTDYPQKEEDIHQVVQPYIEQIETLIKDIKTLDDTNRLKTQNKLAEYGQEIKQVRDTNKGVDTYTNPYQSADGLFFDTKK